MELITAQRYAERITTWLLPYCERLQVAGSIRRERTVCNDVDLVVIPKVDVKRDLLGVAVQRRNLLWVFLERYVAESKGQATWLAGGAKEDGQNYLLQLPKCQLDIFCTTPEAWGTMLLCRTGSKEHNIWLADLVKRRGGHWNPYRYLTLDNRPQDVRTEESIYAACGIDFIQPDRRDAEFLPR